MSSEHAQQPSAGEAGEQTKQYHVEKAGSGTEQGQSMVQEAGQATTEAAQRTKEKVQETGQATKEKAQETSQATKEKAQETSQAAKEKAGQGKEQAAGFLQKTGDKVVETVTKAKETILGNK